MKELPPESQADLVRRFRAGDEDAFETLFERYKNLLARTIRSRLPSHLRRRVDVSDLIQETRLVVFTRRGDFELRSDSAFGSWVIGIGRMKVREAIRHHLHTAKRSAEAEVTRGQRMPTGQHVAENPSPSGVAMSAEDAERARRALERLPADYRQVLLLTYGQGLTLSEAGQLMGRSAEAVRKLCGRAVCRFKEAYDALEGPDRA